MATKKTIPPKKRLYPDLKNDKGALARIAQNLKAHRQDSEEREANKAFTQSERKKIN